MRPFLASASRSPTIWNLRFSILVDERDRCAELDRRSGKLRDVDDFGAAKLILELDHAAFDEGLAFFRGVILDTPTKTNAAPLPRQDGRAVGLTRCNSPRRSSFSVLPLLPITNVKR
jgi:hypothetical protein